MIILGQFFTSTVVIALTMFQLTLVSFANFVIFFLSEVIFGKVDPFSSASLSYLSYVTAITAQIFLYCWFGNEVEFKVR
jgi:hypothetical protein